MENYHYPSGISQADAQRIINETDMNIHMRKDRTNRPVRKVWKCKDCGNLYDLSIDKCHSCEVAQSMDRMEKKRGLPWSLHWTAFKAWLGDAAERAFTWIVAIVVLGFLFALLVGGLGEIASWFK